ncbi:MBL fold metallo-hydrolase [Kocuria tytonis]|uniref:MBL fold metallo-hydrolase n=1 Tax=Kocuria tytonis TaxID=2054280 RepID=A0A495A9F6_9MICC|nr:MBL fold metallo-hydrolase [Kocuria tytonis]RKQ36677.1 MBL fold metallo-hydrolase [Kocuria tytonis]
MLLTKFTHSCVRFEKAGAVLVIDPGTFSEVEEALEGADTVLITHVHPDHCDVDRVGAALDAAPGVDVHAPAAVVEALADRVTDTGRLHAVTADTEFTAGPFSVATYGGQHALIHPLIPTVDNVGYVIDGAVFHPGDSFTVPHGLTVPTVLVPLHAPWSKTSEVIDFVVATRATRAFPIHEALLSDTGLQLVEHMVTEFSARYGTEFRHLPARESVELASD